MLRGHSAPSLQREVPQRGNVSVLQRAGQEAGVGPVGDGVDKTGYKYMQFLMDNYVEVKPLRNDSPLITVYKKI